MKSGSICEREVRGVRERVEERMRLRVREGVRKVRWTPGEVLRRFHS